VPSRPPVVQSLSEVAERHASTSTRGLDRWFSAPRGEESSAG
jgi:hypothetical protein